MSSYDQRQSKVTNELQLPGLVSELSPVDQLPFPGSVPFPAKTTRHLEYETSPRITTPLEDPVYSPGVTGVLLGIQTDALPSPFARSTTTALRQPIVIRGTGKKSPGITRPPRGRRWVISASVTFLLLLISVLTATFVVPTGGEGAYSNSPIQFISSLIHSNNGSPSFIAQQAAATATAVTHQDGYDPGQYGGSGGVPQGGSGGPGRFAFGQCTYWANMRYHELTGYWVPWLGNAYQWTYAAGGYGWVVSSTPKVPSIIVLQPGVQGAGYYGHVAVVERINSDGTVYTSNYNWWGNGGWDRLSYVTFHPGYGVSFLWHP